MEEWALGARWRSATTCSWPSPWLAPPKPWTWALSKRLVCLHQIFILPGLDWTLSYWPLLWVQQQEGWDALSFKRYGRKEFSQGVGVLTPTTPALVSSTTFPPATIIVEALERLSWPRLNSISIKSWAANMSQDLGLAQDAATRTKAATPLGSVAHQVFFKVWSRILSYSISIFRCTEWCAMRDMLRKTLVLLSSFSERRTIEASSQNWYDWEQFRMRIILDGSRLWAWVVYTVKTVRNRKCDVAILLAQTT